MCLLGQILLIVGISAFFGQVVIGGVNAEDRLGNQGCLFLAIMVPLLPATLLYLWFEGIRGSGNTRGWPLTLATIAGLGIGLYIMTMHSCSLFG